jgi:hypothetical protein
MPAKKIVAPAKAAPRRAPVKKPTSAAARKRVAKKTNAIPDPAAKETQKKPAKQRMRLVRDSFTMPEPDFALIAALKARTMAAQRETKKSELLRAGLQVLMALDDGTLMNALGRLQPLKLGRPKKNH